MIKCPECFSVNIVKRGFEYSQFSKKQRYQCKDCKKKFTNDTEKREGVKTEAPKILLFDIETSTTWVRVWDLKHNDYISPKNIIKDWFVICWAAKWLCDDKIISDVVTSQEAIKRDDSRVVKSIRDLLDEADIVIGHNGDNFDIKKVNARIIKWGYDRPFHYQTIDTLKIAKKHFKFTSNTLDYLCKMLGIPSKLNTDMQLWIDCENGDQDALDRMDLYCKNDVAPTMEDVYMHFLPWIDNHPNVGLYMETTEPVCRNCGRTVQPFGRYWYTPSNRFKSWVCVCGSHGRMRGITLSPEKRKALVK